MTTPRENIDRAIAKAKAVLTQNVNDAFGNLYAEAHDALQAISDAAGSVPVESLPPSLPTPTPTPVETPSKPDVALGNTYWLGEWTGDLWSFVRSRLEQDKEPPTFIGYLIPGRDNGNYSAGGLKGKPEYWAAYGAIADAIGNRVCRFIVEPDALGLSPKLEEAARKDRYELIQGAIDALNAKPNVDIILDGSTWIEGPTMATMLNGFTGWDYFSGNISGYKSNDVVIPWAEVINSLTGKKAVLDTSRNGLGNPHEPAWCNVTDTRVGKAPTSKTDSKAVALYIHAKVAGESDGLKINGYDGDGKSDRSDVPRAGVWWPEYADAIKAGNWTAFREKYKV